MFTSKKIEETIKRKDKELRESYPTVESQLGYIFDKAYNEQEEVLKYCAVENKSLLDDEFTYKYNNETGMDLYDRDNTLENMLKKHTLDEVANWYADYYSKSSKLSFLRKEIYNIYQDSKNESNNHNLLNIKLQTALFLYNSIYNDNKFTYHYIKDNYNVTDLDKDIKTSTSNTNFKNITY